MDAAIPRLLQVQSRLLEPLTELEQLEFMRMMKILVGAHAELDHCLATE